MTGTEDSSPEFERVLASIRADEGEVVYRAGSWVVQEPPAGSAGPSEIDL